MENFYYFLIVTFLYLLTNYFIRRKLQNLPPSPPPSLPIFGHLYLIIKKPLHRGLAQISDKYGPLIFLYFGSRPLVLVTSPSAAEECFTKNNDKILANRPRFLAGKYLGYNYTTLVWASYGDHWRNLRRISTVEVLSGTRIQMLSHIRTQEVHSLIHRLLQAKGSSSDHHDDDDDDGGLFYRRVEMKSAFFEMTLNILMRMIAGKRYYGDNATNEKIEEASRFKQIVTESFQVSGATNMVDFLPFLKWTGLNKMESKLKLLHEKRDKFMQELIEERKTMRMGSNHHDDTTMIDVLLSLQESEPQYYTDEIIRGITLVMLSAGTDTSAGTMEWALSLLLNNPEALKKSREEIDIHTGQSRLIDDSDLAHLPYLHGVIIETLRMCPVAPVLMPHESSENCRIGGFRVLRGTMVLVNMWAIQNDPKLWEEPRKFEPERFINMEGQRKGFELLPFGAGRRGCPGENLAMRVIGLALGLLIQCFEWERIGEEMVDMTEGPGLTMPKAQPLLAKCKPRQEMVTLISQL